MPTECFEFAKNLKEYTEKLKKIICGMLNGKGGVILFGCTKYLRGIEVSG